MGGEVVTKLLVLFAGLIACGVCVSPLLSDPAVEEAEEEDILETDVADDPIFADRVVADPAVADRAVVDADPALVDGPAVDSPAVVGDPEDDLVYDGDLDGDAGAAVDTMPDSLTIPDEDVPGENLSAGGTAVVATDPVVGAPVVGAPVVGAPVVGAPLATDPEEVAIPFFVTIPVLLIAILLTGWAMLTPAEALGRPSLIAGVCVLIGTALAWALYAGGVSEFAMTGAALAAWICVGLTLLAAWLVIDVLSTPGEDEAVPG